MKKAEWFKDWFNSPYYHLLYNNRNEQEANLFIDKLCAFLNLQPNNFIWDLACGKGRHAIAINKKGYTVVGTDLANNSIAEANKNANQSLDFYVHDMRTPFTSIGYFSNYNDNFLVFKYITQALKPNGILVVDFFNAKKVCDGIKPNYTEQRGDITFNISKKIENNIIHKKIEFETEIKSYFFEESVSLLNKHDFENFASQSNLTLLHTFGNYNLDAFNENTSDRLILIFKK
jgi:SAM-dependent methyltransferase